MIDSEESCVYCSKYLFGLNDFNKKMHIETCKVRKLVESNTNLNNNNNNTNTNGNLNQNGNVQNNQLEDFMILGENCTYCYKSFKDFKSDFNKKLHIKCCKIKKETLENRIKMNSINNNIDANNSNLNNNQNNGSTTISETCSFCSKQLANLNEFNKRMHIENCKIRKSIEGNLNNSNLKSKSKDKDENLVKLSMELGNQCMYCSKSFVNLSDFNKKLHFEYCKLKKKKLNELNLTNANYQIQNGHSVQINSNNNSNMNGSNGNGNKNNIVDLGDSCVFCSRSLLNLSNFNKKVHIETCKIKQMKKQNNMKMKQQHSLNKSNKKKTIKSPNSKEMVQNNL